MHPFLHMSLLHSLCFSPSLNPSPSLTLSVNGVPLTPSVNPSPLTPSVNGVGVLAVGDEVVTYEDVVKMDPHPQWRRPIILIGKTSTNTICSTAHLQ